MNTSLNRKDIEEFWRRSNSICDQDPPSTDSAESLHVQVRRMSLAEYSGLAPQQKLADIEAPTWKSSVSQSSLLNSFSTRRRSVLSNEPVDSPTRQRITSRIEEEMDVQTAITRLRSIEQKCIDWKRESKELRNSNEKLVSDFSHEKKKSNDAISRIQLTTRQLNQLPSSSSPDTSPGVRSLLSETVTSAHILFKSIDHIRTNSSVYHSELIASELPQVLGSLISFISKLDSTTMSANISTPSRKMSLISSSYSQLIANLNVLNRSISSV